MLHPRSNAAKLLGFFRRQDYVGPRVARLNPDGEAADLRTGQCATRIQQVLNPWLRLSWISNSCQTPSHVDSLPDALATKAKCVGQTSGIRRSLRISESGLPGLPAHIESGSLNVHPPDSNIGRNTSEGTL